MPTEEDSGQTVNYRALENTLQHLNAELQLPRSSNGHDLIYLIEIIGSSIAINGFCPLADGEHFHQPKQALHLGQLWVGRKCQVFKDFNAQMEQDGDRLVWVYNRMRACKYEDFFLDGGQAQFTMLITGELAAELMTRPVHESDQEKQQRTRYNSTSPTLPQPIS